jgi:hypothetical protein
MASDCWPLGAHIGTPVYQLPPEQLMPALA